MAHTLTELHSDKSNLLFLTFLKPVLRELTSTNVAFQSSIADVSKIYKDLRDFVFTMAKRVIKPEALRQSQPGMLRLTELEALKSALQKRDSFKALSLIAYGEDFWKKVAEVKLPDKKLEEVQTACADFLVKFLHELCSRLPSCIEAVQKMRAFTPAIALAARGRPEFKDLPLDLVRKFSAPIFE